MTPVIGLVAAASSGALASGDSLDSGDSLNSGDTPASAGERAPDPLACALQRVLAHYGNERSERSLFDGLPAAGQLTPWLAARALTEAGYATRVVARRPEAIHDGLLPTILLLRDGGAVVLHARRTMPAGRQYDIQDLDDPAPRTVCESELLARYGGHCLLIRPPLRLDDRGHQPDGKAAAGVAAAGGSGTAVAGGSSPARAGAWLWQALWRYRAYYRDAVVATLLINVLSIATALFAMQVYDRVIPHQAYVTMWSLGAGVLVALIFEAVARHLRGHLLDLAGKKADVALSSALFRHTLGLRLDRRPDSSGTLAHQLREFENLRDFGTSATLALVADLPFVLLFIGFVFLIAGDLGFVPLATIPLVALAAIALQWPLRRLMAANQREAAQMHGLMIESIEGMEALRAAGAAGAMQRRYEDFSASTALTAVRMRRLSNLITNLVQSMQQGQMVLLLLVGVYLVHAGKLSPGALMAAMMLANRAVAPLGQFASLATRYQGACAALRTLDHLMGLPTEREADRRYVVQPGLKGRLSLAGASFRYGSQAAHGARPALAPATLDIAAGERVAIVGRIGSGKSTLLRLLAGLFPPDEGQVQLDGIDIRQIDPADRRTHIGFVGQDARLFHGTLRENVMLDRPDAGWEAYLGALRLTGLDRIAADHPLGHDLPIAEGGSGLSGGQRQLVALARALVTRPRVLLLDEPTSAMDLQTEAQFIRRFQSIIAGRTLVLVTHRPSLLKIVDRVIVVDGGKVLADGPKDEVLQWLSGGDPLVNRAA